MITIYEAIQGSLLNFANANSASTERIYRVHLNQLLAYLAPKGITTIDKLQTAHLVEFYNYLKFDYKPKRLSGETSPYAPARLRLSINFWNTDRTSRRQLFQALGFDGEHPGQLVLVIFQEEVMLSCPQPDTLVDTAAAD